MPKDKDVDFPEEKSAQEDAYYALQNYSTKKPKSKKVRIAKICGVLLGAAWILIIHLTPVIGPSMSPAVLEGSRAVAIVYFPWEIPQKGQIVQIRIPEVVLKKYPKYRYISVTLLKRVVAVPGDKVQNIILRSNQYWVQGDNPTESSDSRVFGPIPRSDLLSHVVYVIPPLSMFWPFKKS
jgi:type IV secretory pathway protease TraF